MGCLHVWLWVVDRLRVLLDGFRLVARRSDRREVLTVGSKTVLLGAHSQYALQERLGACAGPATACRGDVRQLIARQALHSARVLHDPSALRCLLLVFQVLLGDLSQILGLLPFAIHISRPRCDSKVVLCCAFIDQAFGVRSVGLHRELLCKLDFRLDCCGLRLRGRRLGCVEVIRSVLGRLIRVY